MGLLAILHLTGALHHRSRCCCDGRSKQHHSDSQRVTPQLPPCHPYSSSFLVIFHTSPSPFYFFILLLHLLFPPPSPSPSPPFSISRLHSSLSSLPLVSCQCGVITSSCEVAASMLLSKEEFMKIKTELVEGDKELSQNAV